MSANDFFDSLMNQAREKDRTVPRSTVNSQTSYNAVSGADDFFSSLKQQAKTMDATSFGGRPLKTLSSIGNASKSDSSAAKTPLLSGTDYEEPSTLDRIKNLGTAVGGSILQGADAAATGISSTLDFLIGRPLQALGWEDNWISQLNDKLQSEREANAEYFSQQLDNDKAAQTVLDLGTAVSRAAWELPIIIMTGGASKAAQAGTKGLQATAALETTLRSSGIGQTVTNAANLLQTRLRDPQVWQAFTSTTGQDYDEQKANGASEAQAVAHATITGLLNALVEVGGGGIQELPDVLRQPSLLRNWVDTMLDEGKEEVVQGVIDRLAENVTGIADHPIYSTTDENAIFNPSTMLQEAGMGALVGGILGGGQIGVDTALNRIRGNTSQNAAEAPTAGAATQTGVDTSTGVNPVEAGIDASVRLFNEGGGVMDAQTPGDSRYMKEIAPETIKTVVPSQSEARGGSGAPTESAPDNIKTGVAVQDGVTGGSGTLSNNSIPDSGQNVNGQESHSTRRATQEGTFDTRTTPADASIPSGGANVNALADSMTDEQLALEQQRNNADIASINDVLNAAQGGQQFPQGIIDQLTGQLPGLMQEQQRLASVEQAKRVQRGEVSRSFGQPENHIDNRNPDSVKGNRVAAFSFDHPQLHGYFVQAARDLQGMADYAAEAERGRSNRGNRIDRERNRSAVEHAYSRELRNAMESGDLSKPQVLDACQRIIDNHGQENVLAAKRVELILDDMLTNGYTTADGVDVAPNMEYIAAKEQIAGARGAERAIERYDDDLAIGAFGMPYTDAELAEQEVERQRIREQYAALNQPAAQTSQNGEVSATDSLGAAPRGFSVGHAPRVVENQRHAVENVVSPENLNPAQTHERLSRQDRQFYSQQRLGVDLEGEMADLQTKQNWNAVDAQTAFDILRMVDQRARQTGSAEDIAEVAKWQALVDRKGSSAGQTLQVYADEARKAGDPAVIAADAANIFAAEEAKQGRNSQGNKAINTVSRGVNRAIRDTRSAISGAFNEASSGKRPAKHSGIVQQVEGQLSLDLGRAEVSRSPEQIQRDIRAALRDIGTTINQVAKADRSNDANLQTQISNILQTKYGFTPDEATNVGEIVGNYFNQMVVEESNRILANTFKTREPSVQRTFEERLNEMMNLGAFSNENYAQLASDALFGGSLDLKDQRHKEALAEIYNYAQRLSDIPEGDTDSTIQLIKELSDRRRTNGLIGGALGERLSAGHDLALEKMAQQPGGAQFLHNLALSQIRQIANDYKSRSASDYVFGVRYLNMLSGLNTVARNLIGNPVFSLTETGANNLGVLFDTLLARKTGMRTLATDRTMFSRAALNGASDAFLRSYLEVAFDADVSNVQSRYGQGGSRTFRMSGNPLERFFSTWEKWNRYMLTTTDEVSKGAARGEITRGLQELQNRGADVSDEFIENRANQVALERTFQNDSAVAQGMRQIQSGLDKMTGGVLGRTAIPFAKIGGNVGTQFANYSPASLVSDTVRLIRTLRDTNRGTVTPEQQANTAMSLGRTITGGALISIFTALALKGILTVASDDDEKDLDRTEGLNGTQLNLSAAWRWLNGESTEYQDGDELLSIGFLEPINGFMSMGSMIADDIESDPDADFWSRVGSIGNATAAGLFQSISELPAMSGLQTIQDAIEYADGDSVGEQVANAAISYIGSQLPSFVVPNFLTNIAEGTDPYVRAPWEADSLGEELLYQVMADIPGLRQNVPVRQDIWGQDMTYTDSDAMNFINQTISPGAITTYHTNWANQEARRLGNLPPDVPDSFSVDGETVQLNQAQQREYSRVRGSTALEIINELERNPIYADMSLEEQNALWDKIYDYAGDIAKRSIDSRYELDGANASAENYGDPAEYFLYNEAWKAVEGSKGANTAAFEAVMQGYKRMSTQKQNALMDALGENTRFDDVVDAYEAGIDPERWYEAYDKHQELNENENLSANSAATEFAKWLDTESGFNANQRDVIEEQMRFWNMFPADTERYDALIDAGFTPEKADAVYDAVSALQPQQGKTQVSDLQRYEAIANMSGLTDAEKVQALTEYEGASSGDRQKFSTAYAYGISPELYVNMLEMQDEGVGDEDGNGRYKQDEAKLLIDTLMDSNSDMTTREAAILWAMLCPTSKTGNPYGNIYGSTSMEWDYAP